MYCKTNISRILPPQKIIISNTTGEFCKLKLKSVSCNFTALKKQKVLVQLALTQEMVYLLKDLMYNRAKHGAS